MAGTLSVTPKIVMISPHHADCDYRVRRVINVLHRMGVEVDIYWDERYLGHQSLRTYEDHVREFYRKNRFKEALFSIAGRRFLNEDIENSIKSCAIVYVNASALIGLLYAREAKRINPNCYIIYDYHDSITYELYYQLSKRGFSMLYRIIWPLYRVFCRNLAKHVDALVGISKIQVAEFPTTRKSKIATAVVPNFRRFEDFDIQPQPPEGGENIGLMWLGQVMLGRDLEKLSSWIAMNNGRHNLYVFGKVIDEAAPKLISEKLDGFVNFYGEFRNELEILNQLPRAPIGIFLGWEDPAGTNINGHASPNKYFTYINMGIPVIIAASLTELARDVLESGAGIAVSTQFEFDQAIMKIEGDYSKYSSGALGLKKIYQRTNPEHEIRHFLEKAFDERTSSS